jgi:zinc protease
MVHAYNEALLEPGAFITYARSTPENIQQVTDIIFANIEKVKRGDFTDEEIEKAKQVCIIADALSRQTNSEIAMDAALNELYGLGYDFSEKYPDRIKQVTAEEVKRVAGTYLTNYVLSVTRPEGLSE